MKTWFLLVLLLLIPLAGYADTSVQTAQPAFNNRGSPEEFLRDLYSRYDFEDLAKAPQILDRDAVELADPVLLRLILKERQLSNGEAGVFESDPICDCQDFDKAIIEKLELLNHRKNNIDIKITFSLAKNWTGYVEVFSLVKIDGKWKIRNIKYNHSIIYMKNCFSLLNALKFSLKTDKHGN